MPVKAKITRFGYIIDKKSLEEDEVTHLRKDLTVKPYKPTTYSKFIKVDDSFPIYVENGDYIGIPKYFGIERYGQPEVNKLETYKYPKFDMEYLGQLRPNQVTITNKVIEGFKEHRGGVMICGCGSGKTNMAIWLACKYKLKTLFIVHKEFLMNQVINRIKSTTNCQDVGIIQQNITDTDHAFTVGMVQSLAKKDYDDQLFKDYGLIIIDEVHHMGARNFSKVYRKMTAKYMLGISAERSRNDRTYGLIHWYMGPILHAEEQKPNEMVVVKKYHYSTSNTERTKLVKIKGTEEPDRSTMVSNLVCIKRRNRFLLKIIEDLYDQGKNVLFLTDRLTHIEVMYKLLNQNEYIKGNVGKYIGSMKQSKLDESATKQVILGTYAMASEGLDIADLNAVILATPKSAVKQSIGRILRRDEYEEHPIVIDIIDNDCMIFKNQAHRREQYYFKQKYNIQNFYVKDYISKDKEKFNQWDDEEFIHESLVKVPDVKKVVKQEYVKTDFTQVMFVD
jgi:superfamily II DNA or RNA helicase